MRDISTLSMKTELFGQALSMPVVLSPVGLAGMYARRGETQAARGAKAAGVPFSLSTVGVCTVEEVAKAAFNPAKWPKGKFEGGLYENATFKGEKDTYPNGCHICEVEIDPETGDVTPDRYFVVDDVGTVMNPIGLKGQIHGGVAQGIGQILCEQVVWDRDSGQLLTASFLDYAMPHAQMVPNMEVKSNPVPTKFNPLGAKGAGEAGTVGAMPVVMNAIMDALAPLGVKDVAMPATSLNVWRAIEEAKK